MVKYDESQTELFLTIIRDGEIRTKKLNELGYNSHRIRKMKDEGFLKISPKATRGIYTLCSVKDLYRFALSFNNKPEHEQRIEYLRKCLELDPSFGPANYHLFIEDAQAENFKDLKKYLDVLFSNTDEKNIKNINFYLFMLNLLIELPNPYDEISGALTLEDILLPTDSRLLKNCQLDNDVRLAILCSCYEEALNLISHYPKNKHLNHRMLIKKLLTKIIDKKKEAELRGESFPKNPTSCLEEAQKLKEKKKTFIKELLTQTYVALINGDTETAMDTMHYFLIESHLEEYHYLLKDLTFISRLYEDHAYMETILTACSLLDGTFSFEDVSYTSKAEKTLEEGHIKEALLYLDIVYNALKCGHLPSDSSEISRLDELMKRMKVQRGVEEDLSNYTIKPKKEGQFN